MPSTQARLSSSLNWDRYLIAMVVLGVAMAGPFSVVWAEEPAASTIADSTHWAFRAVNRPPVPVVGRKDLVENAVDAFVLQQLEARQLSFSRPAERRDFIRRAKLDLLGLPPTIEEVEAFIADTRPDAYARLIDGFLASPHYGETWGRMWLDVVRFAETAGFNADPDRPLAYKYRDYVIRSFNDDKPYDRFVQEQLAGDELFPESVDALTATGFDRMWPDESNASDILLARQDALNDLTANVGAVFLGLSLGCAQCHDHKFDPILQTDFYRLQAFFSGIVLEDRVPVGTHQQLTAYQRDFKQWCAATDTVRSDLHRIETAARVKASGEKRMKFPPVVLAAIDTPLESRTAFQRQLFFWTDRQILVDEKQMLAEMPKEQKERRPELKRQVAECNAHQPHPPGIANVMATIEIETKPPATHLLAGGSYTKPLEEVQPGFPEVLSAATGSAKDAEIVSPREGTSGRRTALAKWLTNSSNPLVARVIVNRVWQEHFGKGLVENANDFGTLTAPPTHPELLDWLTSEFVAQGWSIKQLHRLIMTSNVYRQSTLRRNSRHEATPAETVDPDNQLYWHFDRRRLSAERTRDAMLFVAGKMNAEMYGPGVRPKLPEGFNVRESWKVTPDANAADRRSVYIYAKRNLPYPLLQTFDLPDMNDTCPRRSTTTTAPQALSLLNSEDVLDAAQSFAASVRSERREADRAVLVRRAYARAFDREPNEDELKSAGEFLSRQEFRVHESAVGKIVSSEDATSAAFTDLCHALLNANEFLFVE